MYVPSPRPGSRPPGTPRSRTRDPHQKKKKILCVFYAFQAILENETLRGGVPGDPGDPPMCAHGGDTFSLVSALKRSEQHPRMNIFVLL